MQCTRALELSKSCQAVLKSEQILISHYTFVLSVSKHSRKSMPNVVWIWSYPFRGLVWKLLIPCKEIQIGIPIKISWTRAPCASLWSPGDGMVPRIKLPDQSPNKSLFILKFIAHFLGAFCYLWIRQASLGSYCFVSRIWWCSFLKQYPAAMLGCACSREGEGDCLLHHRSLLFRQIKRELFFLLK